MRVLLYLTNGVGVFCSVVNAVGNAMTNRTTLEKKIPKKSGPLSSRGGGVRAFVVGPLKRTFFAASLREPEYCIGHASALA